MEKVKMGVVGLGSRGYMLICGVLTKLDDVEVVSVCDVYTDRCEKSADYIEKASGKRPEIYTDYNEMLEKSDMDAVFIATAWEYHVDVSIAAMKKGVAVALEVGGAYAIERLWEMVRVQESTKTPFMLMENCCFGREEMLVSAMARAGVFGDIVHGHGAYAHYLCEEIAGGDENRHYRLRNYLSRNCENYPTHELGPIAKIFDINRGNRMISLVSVASRAAGMEDYINENADRYPELVGKKFMQGDIVNTIITCAAGSTISLRLATTLPRSYSREFTIRGTRGMYEQNTNTVYLAGQPESFDPVDFYSKNMNNAKEYEEKYLPAAWRAITEEQIKAGHGGMDHVEFCVFVDCLKNGKEMPIDIYDAASWMAVSALSENSIAQGGLPQAIPDFTDGKWILRKGCDVFEC